MDCKPALQPPEISVVIAAHNAEAFISRAINSALAQDSVSLEVIVVDDGSTDRTHSIISSCKDPRVIVSRLEHNCGPSVARNAGFALARGTWIAVLDADDRFAPGRLARLHKLALATDADIVVDNVRVYPQHGARPFPMFAPERFHKLAYLNVEALIRRKLHKSDRFTLGFLKPLFSARFLHAHGLAYPEQQRIGEDYTLLLNALVHGAYCVIDPNQGYYYSKRVGSLTQRVTSQDVRTMIEMDGSVLLAVDLSTEAKTAQLRRSEDLELRYTFLLLLETVKRKKWLQALRIISSKPLAVLFLWLPVKIRLKNLYRRD